MRTVPLLSKRVMPVLGQGTWRMGEDPRKKRAEVFALKLGIDLGMTLIDTAEMYGDGGAEKLVGEAVAGRRQDAFIVSKLYPYNATRKGTFQACERSLRRLQTDYLDLYLLHWRGSVPLSETLEAFQLLQASGKIRGYGVSNFDTEDMEELSLLEGGEHTLTNQVLYNLVHREIEWELLPWCRARSIPLMAYSPIEHSKDESHGMLSNPVLQEIGSRYGVSAAQAAISWLLHQDVIVIPKASTESHVRENRAALDIRLTPGDLDAINRAFPPPSKKMDLPIR